MLNLFTVAFQSGARTPFFPDYANFVQGLKDWIVKIFEMHGNPKGGHLDAEVVGRIMTNLPPTDAGSQTVATHGYI